MMLTLTMAAALFAAAPAAPPRPAIAAHDFEVWYRDACTGRLEVPRPVAARAGSYRYVFVGGYRNESIRGYFRDNIAELVRQGIPADRIEVVDPSSEDDDATASAHVGERLAAIAGRGPERLVVIGHSRGACLAMAAALADPSLTDRRVAALFLIQGPFGGSEAAAHLVGEGTPMDRRMPPLPRLVAWLAERAIRSGLTGPGRAVVASLVPRRARQSWAGQVADHPEAAAIVGPRTFYITSVSRPARLGPVRRAIGRYLATYHGASDGIILLGDQSIPGVGRVVATVEAGHADLTQRTFRLRRTRKLRTAVADAIVMMMGRDPGPVAADASSGQTRPR